MGEERDLHLRWWPCACRAGAGRHGRADFFAKEPRGNIVMPIDDNLQRGYEAYLPLHRDQHELVCGIPGTCG